MRNSIIITPADAVKRARRLVRDKMKEHFIGLYCDTRNKVIHTELISLGTLNSTLVHPREVYAPALKRRAAFLIALHNHPSEDVEPSEDDIEITKRLKEAGKILGIELVDHIIFDKSKHSYSFREKGNCW